MAKAKKMKTWYCVVESYYDDGHVTAAIVDEKEAIEKPEGHMSETRRADIYCDWYDDLREAKQAVKNARSA